MARFRLERLLRLRSQLRSMRRIELQQSENARERLLAESGRLQDERRAVLETALDATAQKVIDGATLALARDYEHALGERVRLLAEERARLAEQIALQRERLGAERREERKLDHLAQRHRERLELEAALASERLLDELMLARHAREAREGRRDG